MLSKRETEIVKLVVEVYQCKHIAEQLHISIHTVHTHRKKIVEETKLKTIYEVISYAIINKLF